MCLTVRKERVGLHVPWTGTKATGPYTCYQLVASRRSHLEVVVEHDRLAIEHETKAGVGGKLVEHGIDRVDES